MTGGSASGSEAWTAGAGFLSERAGAAQLPDQAKMFDAEKQTVNSQREANDRRAAELEAAARKQQQDVDLAVEE